MDGDMAATGTAAPGPAKKAAGSGTSGAGKLARFPCGPRTKWIVVVFWILVAAGMGPLAGKLGDVQENDAVNWLPGSAESTHVYKTMDGFKNPNEADGVVLLERRSGLTDADRQFAQDIAPKLRSIKGVHADVQGPFESDDHQAIQFTVPFDMGAKGDGWKQLPDFTKDIKALDVPGDGLLLYVTGPAGFNGDFADAFNGTEGAMLIAAMIVVIAILLLTYRSPWLWLLPVLSAGIALSVGMGIVYLFAKHGGLTVTAQAQIILSIVVFGAGTDYALLLVARYREELRKHEDRHEAMAFALHRAGPAVFASGTTVLLSMLCLSFADMNSTASLGPVLAIGIGIGLLVMMSFLPALLVLGGRKMFWPVHPDFGTPDPVERGIWAKIAGYIKLRPRPIWIGTALALGALTFGVTQLSADGLTYKDSFTNVPDSIVGQNALSKHFPSGSGDPVIVLARADKAQDVADALDKVPGVVPGSVKQAPPQGPLAYMEATLTDNPDSTKAKDTIGRVRNALHDVGGAEAITGGSTAVALDTEKASHRDDKVVIPITLAVVLLILMLLLRALVAPLLLLATVILSFGAAFGFSSIIFNHVLGYAGMDGGLPLFSFVFLVALGIDYNIFLMTRIQEETRRVGTREGAVIGLTATGAVITSAGLVLAGTFSVMTAIPMVFLVEMGFVVAFGVLLDTFIVRSVLVTALALDFGRMIWWPHPMSRKDWVPTQPGPADAVDAIEVAPLPALVGVAAAVNAEIAHGVAAPAPISEPVTAVAPVAPVAPPGPVAPPVTPPPPAPPLAANAPVVSPVPAPSPATNGSNGRMGRVTHENLLAGPPATLLPELVEARDLMDAGTDATEVAARFPDYSRAWATLADAAFTRGSVVESYAYARTGYHRGLDALRRNGWRGHGPVPWDHEPNQGFLRSLHGLGRAAAAIGEEAEAQRCFSFLAESSQAAADALAAPRS
jgi:RND superfamily putative drug exporter